MKPKDDVNIIAKTSDVASWRKLFETGQYGRFYVVSSEHAHGLDFRVQVLPKGEEAKPNGRNDCTNENAVLVFGPKWRYTGIQGGEETYKHEWFYNGPWIADFEKLADELQQKRNEQKEIKRAIKAKKDQAEKERIAALLTAY